MQELLKNAWMGWQNYTNNGKYAALLIVVLLFFWFRREECKEKLLLVYTTVMVVCCIFPVSAALLMTYQTRFYDYEWIWSYVPVTLMIAYGAVIFLSAQWEICKKNEKALGKWSKFVTTGLTATVIVLIILSGRMGMPAIENQAESPQQEQVEQLLSVLAETADGQEICLWAPREIMVYARAARADIRLIYGKDMWDPALGAYAYDTYGETEQMLYQWMCNAEETGKITYKNEEGKKLKGLQCMKNARKAGVNRVLLPDTLDSESVQKWAKKLKAEVQELEGYYLFVL